MKALKLSTLAACLLLFVASCTKTVDTLSSSSTSTTSSQNAVMGAKAGGQGGEQQGGSQQGQPDNPGGGNTKVTPALTITYNPTIGIKDQPVTVTGTFDGTTAIPQCGKFQLQQLVNGAWVAVGTQVDVTPTNDEITYTFTPTVVGPTAYSFRLHYIASGQGCDFNQVMSEPYTLEVVNPCLPLNLVIAEVKGTQQAGTNMYDFEVTYRVTSCPSYTGAKLQGGLTAVTGFDGSDLSSSDAAAIGQERKNTNNDNHIIQWNFEMGANYNHWFKVKFTKELKTAGTHQITGNWSVEATNPNTGEKVRVETPSAVFTK
jgi:hypothetical protein